jgi:hypothetical protein
MHNSNSKSEFSGSDKNVFACIIVDEVIPNDSPHIDIDVFWGVWIPSSKGRPGTPTPGPHAGPPNVQ